MDIDLLLPNHPPTTIEADTEYAANVTGDGVVNILDRIRVVGVHPDGDVIFEHVQVKPHETVDTDLKRMDKATLRDDYRLLPEQITIAKVGPRMAMIERLANDKEEQEERIRTLYAETLLTVAVYELDNKAAAELASAVLTGLESIDVS